MSVAAKEPAVRRMVLTGQPGSWHIMDVPLCYNEAMFVTFFHELKSAGVPVTLREYLTLMEAMEQDLASRRVEDFYYLSRAALIKDERHLDRFDRVFGHVFKGLELLSDALIVEIPTEWLKKPHNKYIPHHTHKMVDALSGH